MNPLHPPRPDPAQGQPVWPGLPVTCSVCLRAGAPVMTDDGWRLPIHTWEDWLGSSNCPGSLAAVGAPVATSMEKRIEDNVVAAMPERINEEWDTP